MEAGMAEIVLLLFVVFFSVHRLLVVVWWRPKRIQKHFRNQGVRGPAFMPVTGSLGELAKIYASGRRSLPLPSDAGSRHATLELVFPHLKLWKEKYGRVMLYWYGWTPRLSVTDPKVIREVTGGPRKYSQSIQNPAVHNLIGSSILAAGGEPWAVQRRLHNPLFLSDSIKGLAGLMHSAVKSKVDAWSKLLEYSDEVEIDMSRECETLAQFIITKVIFGEDVDEGLHIARLQCQQGAICADAVKGLYIPGSRFLPTKMNRRSKKLREEVEKRIQEIIDRRELGDERRRSGAHDWLAVWLSSSSNMSRRQVVNDVAMMLTAGSESTNLLLTWATILLSIYTDWQDKARREIREALLREEEAGGGQRPSLETLTHLKILNMIIHETLRMYPSVPFVMKRAEEDITLDGEGIRIPAGTYVEMPIISVHYDPQLWGDNADQFDPGRFADGVAKAAKHPMAFMPFMQGPRICMGMNFALMEARTTLAMILMNFELRLSPNYVHEPVAGITLKPGKGAPVIVTKITEGPTLH